MYHAESVDRHIYFANVALETECEQILNENEELNHIFKMCQNHANILRIQEQVWIDSPFQL